MHLPTLVTLVFNAWMGIGLGVESSHSKPSSPPCTILQVPKEQASKDSRLLEKVQKFVVEKYELQGNAFCTFTEKENTSLYSSLAVSRKTSFGINGVLEVLMGPSEVIEKLKRRYIPEEHDFFERRVYTPSSTISKTYFVQPVLDRVLIFAHERFHEKKHFPQRSLNEGLARYASYAVAADFFSCHPEYIKEKDALEKRIQQERIKGEKLLAFYNDLQKLYAEQNLTEEQKLDLREFTFDHLQKEFPGERPNNASLAWDLQYVGLLPFLDDVHQAMGRDSEKTLAFYYALPENAEGAFSLLKKKCREVQCREEGDMPQKLW